MVHWLLYLRLIVLTAGTLLPFFWMVVILGHRRQRNFERVFFFLCLALTCFFGSSLLALNARLFYGLTPEGLRHFAWTVLCLGLFFSPPLTLHLHAEYASLRGLTHTPSGKYLWLGIAWLPTLLLIPNLWRALQFSGNVDFEQPTHLIGLAFQAWLVIAVVVSAVWQYRFQTHAPDKEQRSFHQGLVRVLTILSFSLIFAFWEQRKYGNAAQPGLDPTVLVLALVPFALLILDVKRFNFLQIGRQRNLIFAVFGVFLALLYLSFVRRAGQWLEPYLPPEATAALLLFLPVAFFEPLQRLIRRLLRQTAQSEVDRAQKLMGPINEVARLGDLEKLRQFAESWIGGQLQLAEVHLCFDAVKSVSPLNTKSSQEETFEIHRGSRHIGTMAVRSHGAMVSGETYAGLEFVAEQLPAAFDLCRLIEEKLQLERELAERERLALVGQMAASISHNLKNPLGSIKTILQVQMESPELPDSWRHETKMVLDEINRLSKKLNQLLQFSRPGTLLGNPGASCNIAQVARDVVQMLNPEAARREVALELRSAPEHWAAANGEAANDILTNLILNAIEATSAGGHVAVQLEANGSKCHVVIEDDGSGIPAEIKEKVLQPFFTTKPLGTGLGLAIVQKRVEELGGKLEWTSPARNGAGTRFKVALSSSANKAPAEKP